MITNHLANPKYSGNSYLLFASVNISAPQTTTFKSQLAITVQIYRLSSYQLCGPLHCISNVRVGGWKSDRPGEWKQREDPTLPSSVIGI